MRGSELTERARLLRETLLHAHYQLSEIDRQTGELSSFTTSLAAAVDELDVFLDNRPRRRKAKPSAPSRISH